jgi:hypothetical protein
MRSGLSPRYALQRCGWAARDLFPATLLTLALFIAIAAYGAATAGGGYSGAGGLNVTLGLLGVVWSLGFIARCSDPHSKLAAAIEALTLFLGLNLFAALATEALALGGGAYIDDSLVAIDRMIVPFADWRDLALALPHHPALQSLLTYCYVALNWQAFAFIALACFLGSQRDMEALLTAWGTGLMACILPFHWLPALGPYAHYGIGQGEIAGARVMLPWAYPAKLEALRSGAGDTIGLDMASGLVTVPSFHACGAVVFGWAFWRFRRLLWPMLALNAAMFIAAVPIGGHYFIDVIAGGAAGSLAIAAANALARYRAGRDALRRPASPASTALA